MATKITVNGVTYDGVDAMPPDARRLYDEMLAKLPALTDRDGDGIPDIVQSLPVQQGPTVRKQFIINGTTYDDVSAMPPAVRLAYETAMRAMGAVDAKVTKNDIKVSFQYTGPVFRFGKKSSAPSSGAATDPGTPRQLMSGGATPIEPESRRGAVTAALVLAALVAAGLAYWFLVRGH